MNVRTLSRTALVTAFLALSVAAFAQESRLSGMVTDINGKPVVGAKVRALLPGPGDNIDVVTNAKGEYEVPVKVGDWIISVEMQSFATERKQLVVDLRSTTTGAGHRVDFTLKSADAAKAAAPFNPPRTADGQPDIQGTWNDDHATGDSINYDLETGHRSPEHYAGRGEKPVPNPDHAIADPPSGLFPYTPEARAQRNHNTSVYQNPPTPAFVAGRSKCWLPGSPGYASSGNPTILQVPGYVIMMIEFSHSYRIIPLTDTPHVGSNILLMSGDQRGHWEGNTLVVDITSQKGQWLDLLGNFRSDAAHVVERWSFTSPTTMRYEATIDDPKVYTQPVKVGFNFNKRNDPKYELYEDSCHEGNADVFGRLSKRPQ